MALTIPEGYTLTGTLDIPADTLDWLVELIKQALGDNSKRQQFLIDKIKADYIARYN